MFPLAGRRVRASVLALVLTLSVGLSAAPAAALATPEPTVVLAVEEEPGGGSGELPGPSPDLDNTYAPEEFEAPWTWWLGVVLTAVTVLTIGGMGLGYMLLVRRDDES